MGTRVWSLSYVKSISAANDRDGIKGSLERP